MSSCSFISNSTWRWGGAIFYDEFGEPSGGLVEFCDFVGNSSESGGIIQLMNSADPNLRNLTIVGNAHSTAIQGGCCYTAPVIENCLIAFNQGGYGIEIPDLNPLTIYCTNVFGNEYGEFGDMPDPTGSNGNISEDPLFCDSDYQSLDLAEESPCLPENNECGVLMGGHGAACTLTATESPLPAGIRLEANYPNPFNPATTIPFSLDMTARVTVSIHDASGRLVRLLAQERDFEAGRHELRWDGRDAAGRPASSGVYFYRLETKRGGAARAMLLVK